MRSLFIAPHNDDEVLFGTYTLLRYKPDVLVCTLGATQDGVELGMKRVGETAQALAVLGLKHQLQLPIPDSDPDWELFERYLTMLSMITPAYDHVFAPMVEDGGHDQHNAVGQIARDVFRSSKILTGYATYRRGSGRTQTKTEVGWEEGWQALKLRAMACYESQIENPHTRPWFFSDDAHREWYE